MSEQELIRRQNDQRTAEATALGAKAALENAQLNLEFTQVKAPVDGYVTNLNLRLGSQAVQNQPALALVHIDKIPEGVALRVGTTASVLVMTGTAGRESGSSAVAAPRALQ